MRLIFLGSDAIGLPALEFLRTAAGVTLAGVITRPDRPSGRGQQVHANPVAAWARERGIALRQPAQPGAEDLAWMRAEGVDAALVMAYGRILREDFLQTPPRGVWNLHASLLPAYRGASPVEAALAMGDASTGVCLMQVVPALDAGPVADAESVRILPDDTSLSLRERLGQAVVPLLARNLAALGAGGLTAIPQDEARVSYTRKLAKADALLDFALPAVELERRVRALHPWPGAVVNFAGEALKAGAVTLLPTDHTGAAPGTVLAAGPEGVDIATIKGVLRLRALQRPGGRMLNAADFLRGHPIPVGTVLASQTGVALVSPRPFPRAAKAAPPTPA
jgi:methionyl-tRNA formyltransferase